ncbi:exocyst complex component EXO70B1-like [Cornus florida]|uniref:exocyst complex component EXO70B1-like n=1 Tax=Cornus florida TaxID=4283 RepID=UPI00289E10FC|nr:exocyst complex component EXO70B1-like [Cornus florida]XP_059640028.1 exocyst complex component EXO70B1-like [Cornus florida]
MAATVEGQDRVMATAQQIVKSLNTSKDAAEDMIMIFQSFDNRLSSITDLMSGTKIGDCETDSRFDAAEKIVLRWESNSELSRHSLPWEDLPDEAAEYLSAVDEILQLTEDLNGGGGSESEIMDRAEIALQMAMSRLEEEFRHILIRNTVPLDADRLYGSIRRVSLSFASNDVEIESFDSFGEIDQLGYCHERDASLGDDLCVDLISPDAVVDLKEIADRMIRSGYEKECCQAYINVRRDVLDECMSILGVERLSIDEVQKIEWKSLDEKMKKWVHAIKISVRVLLSGEKRLCEQIFSGSELIKEVCFVETAKASMMQLLNFGEAVAIGKRSSEKLFRILDMYDVLVDVLPDLQMLFTDEPGTLVCSDAGKLVEGLGDAAIGTLVEFENAVKGEASRKPIQGGEIHPLTRYVMNYLKLLVDYSDSLNAVLEITVDKPNHLLSDNRHNLLLEDMSLVAQRLLLLITSLESNLEEKSRLYEDIAMQYIFLMNNTLYIVQKIKDSELGKILGDQYVRKRRGQIRQHATSYLRASWSKALSCLKDEGIGGSTSNASRVALKERFKNFNACFEDIYRTQSTWKVPDAQLREELRISISEKVLPAYRAFMGRFGSQLEGGRHAGKYIKYTPDDLENYLLDLFEGTPGNGIQHHLRRKST